MSDVIAQHEADKDFCKWIDRVKAVAEGAGISLDKVDQQLFEYLYVVQKESPGNAVKRIADTMV